MALYLGSNQVKLVLNGTLYSINIFSSKPILKGIQLFTLDEYALRDSNGLYLTAKEDE